MSFRLINALSLATVLSAAGWLAAPARGQSAPAKPQGSAPAFDNAQEAARRQILESERWQRARRALDEWLSIQQIYGPDEVAVLRAESQARIAKMSPVELQNHLENLEAKLAVLASPEAEDARRWLSQFLAVQAKYSEKQLRQMRPDIAHMTAAQIRQELANFQKRRGVTQQTHAAAEQGRALQVQSAQGVQAARQQASEEARARASQGVAISQAQRQNAPRAQDLPGHSVPPVRNAPFYTVGPWGNPILWDPMVGFW